MSPTRYAQHFLVDKSAIETIIADLKLTHSDVVLEIGPGRGALTTELIKKVKHLSVVEVDQKMITLLKDKLGGFQNFTLFHNDILKFDLNLLASDEMRYKVVGNLPYNLTSPILRRLSDWTNWTEGSFMVQKEVGDRLCAKPGGKDYGALTVGMNLTCEMRPVFELSPDSFRPRPRIWSAVVHLTRRPQPLTQDMANTQRVIQAAFQQRRKTIVNSLAHGLGLPKESLSNLVQSIGLDPSLRPERIPVNKFIEISECLKQQ